MPGDVPPPVGLGTGANGAMGRPRTGVARPKGNSPSELPPRPQAGRLFDHGGTVFFSAFMALWAVLLLEYWKRQSATLAYRWGCSDYEDIEVGPQTGPPPSPPPPPRVRAAAECRLPSRRGHGPSSPPRPPRRP